MVRIKVTDGRSMPTLMASKITDNTGKATHVSIGCVRFSLTTKILHGLMQLILPIST